MSKKKIKIPDFDMWDSSFVFCVDKKAAFAETSITYICTVSTSPKLNELGRDFDKIKKGLRSENSKPFYEYLNAFHFFDISVEADADSWSANSELKSDITKYYAEQRFILPTNFTLLINNHDLEPYSTDSWYLPGPWISYIPKNEDVFIRGLNLFNAISAETIAPYFRCIEMLKSLREIYDLMFAVQFEHIPHYRDWTKEDFFQSYNLPCIPRDALISHQLSLNKINEIVRLANIFSERFKEKPKDSFDPVDITDVDPDALTLYKTAYEGFIGSFLTAVMHEAIKNKAVERCLFCWRYFAARTGKKYCSLVAEGRNCSKRASGRRDYYKHQNKRLHSKKAWIKNTRREIPGY